VKRILNEILSEYSGSRSTRGEHNEKSRQPQ
jgi:hypothetical protein